MNSSVRSPRIFRPATEGDDVFVLGALTSRPPSVAGPTATVQELLEAASRQALELLEAANAEAAAVIGAATRESSAIREQARADGHEHGRAVALDEAASLLDLLRAAASEGASIRSRVADEASAVITRAVLLAVRRITGGFYEEDPARTAAAVAAAVRAASSQEILSIRVHPGAEPSVAATLADLAGYIRPDHSIAVGGAIIDLRNGTIDATLDARLSLMELAIKAASGEDV